jgi:hypothetical protein
MNSSLQLTKNSRCCFLHGDYTQQTKHKYRPASFYTTQLRATVAAPAEKLRERAHAADAGIAVFSAVV